MKTAARILPAILGIACLTSCTALVSVPKYYSPEIAPTESPATIVFINSFDYTNPAIVKEKTSTTYRLAVKYFIKGLLEAVSSDDSLTIIVADTLRRDKPEGMLTTLLPIEAIDDLCKKNDAILLITLDSVYVGFYNQDDLIDSYSYLNFYSRRFFLFGEFYLTAYDCYGDLINRSSVYRSYFYSWRMALLSGFALNPSLAASSRKIDHIALPCGKDYSAKFYPKIDYVERKVYRGGMLEKSYTLMKKGSWDEAVWDLMELPKSQDHSFSRKAEQNLGVAREGAQGRMN